MDDSTIRVAKAIGLAVVAPAALYFLIFHHFRCETDGEQLAAAVLGIAGLGAAIKWA